MNMAWGEGALVSNDIALGPRPFIYLLSFSPRKKIDRKKNVEINGINSVYIDTKNNFPI